MDISAIQSVQTTQNEKSNSTAKVNGSSDFSNVLKQQTSSKAVTMDDLFQKAADTYGVDVKLLKAIAMQESSFHTTSTSHSGAQGLMQLMPETAKELGVKDAYDPEQNIMGGAKYISQLLKKYNGNVTLALAAYNAGPGNVKKYGGVPPFKETQNYVKKVTNYYKKGVTIPDSLNKLGGNYKTTGFSATAAKVQGAMDNTSTTNNANTSEDPHSENAILNLNDEQLAAVGLGTGTDTTELLSSLQTLLGKINDSKDTTYSYDDYARFMKVYLDGVAIDALSKEDATYESDLAKELSDKLSEYQEGIQDSDALETTKNEAVTAFQALSNRSALSEKLLGPEYF